MSTRDLFRPHNLKTNSMVKFSELCHVFAPGSLVYVKNNNIPQKIWKVVTEESGRFNTDIDISDPSLTRPSRFVLICYYSDFNGQQYFFPSHNFSIEAFQGTELLANLSVVLLATAQACGLINADELVERGRDFVAYTHPTHLDSVGRNQMLHPDGTGINPSPHGDSQDNVIRYSELIDSDVMVDMDRGYFSVPSFRKQDREDDPYHRPPQPRGGAREV
ncbi:hypothetical protein V8F33_003407 [Rhypophila sp. PSN 637]